MVCYAEYTMDKRVNQLIDNYHCTFRERVRQKAMELRDAPNALHALSEFVINYEPLVLQKDAFVSTRSRNKPTDGEHQCNAKRANGEQCTRRRQSLSSEFCGTHMKRAPHGTIAQPELKVSVWAEEIKGIMYYIDGFGNVYSMEDMMQKKERPTIIAKYVKTNNEYCLMCLDNTPLH